MEKKKSKKRTLEVVKELLATMVNKNRWRNISHGKSLAKCTFLDPPFKTIPFSTNDTLSENIKTEVTDEVASIIQQIIGKQLQT